MKQKKSLQKKQKGFTLIELLIVITIIGILATWAVAIYTSQIQKARDTTRISDISALKSGVEQVYQDTTTYPDSNNFAFTVSTYINSFPKDSKHGQSCGSTASGGTATACALAYVSGADENSITLWSYELSTGFESKWNRDSKAKGDNGDDDLRWETGVWIKLRSTVIASLTGSWTTHVWICDTSGGQPASWVIIVINGNPTITPITDSSNECG